MVAPKGSGLNVRRNFLTGAGINSSFAVEQDATGHAEERCLAVGIGIGSGYLFPTTFQHEVFSDLTGERGVLMGALAGIMEAQYDVLRAARPHAERSLQRNRRGTHAEPHPAGGRKRHGLDVLQLFRHRPARRAGLEAASSRRPSLPVFKELYNRVKTGKECARVLSACGAPNYQVQLAKELGEIHNSEMWRAGAASRALRPKQSDRAIAKGTKGVSGRMAN